MRSGGRSHSFSRPLPPKKKKEEPSTADELEDQVNFCGSVPQQQHLGDDGST